MRYNVTTWDRRFIKVVCKLTITSPVVHKSVPRKTVAVVSPRGVHTPLRAPSIVLLAFILATLVSRLVLPVGTVRLLIAHLAQGDAHPTPAFELSLLVALWHRGSAVLLVTLVRTLGVA